MDALILAGGENKRLPIIKGFIEIDGVRVIDRNLRLLKNIFNKVILSTNSPELYFYLGVLMVGDRVKDKGPMGGIYSVLNIHNVSEIFVTACDMPFLNTELIHFIICKWRNKIDALIPFFNKKPQPLLGIYSKKILYKMEKYIINGEVSLMKFLKRINTLYISENDIRKIDPQGQSFININTLEDMQKEIGGKRCLV